MLRRRLPGLNQPRTDPPDFDLYVNSVNEDLTIGTGVHVEIPKGYVGLVVPRSSWGVKGFKLANTVGVIDSDYRGEIKMVEIPTRPRATGDRAGRQDCSAWLLCGLRLRLTVDSLDQLSITDRGDGGFGSTGG